MRTPPELNRKLLLEAPLRTPDGAGGYTESWAEQGVVWAAVRPGNGRDTALAGLPVAEVPLKITLRAAPHGAPSRPVAGQRFREGARIYSILAVAEADPAARYLICAAREEVSP